MAAELDKKGKQFENGKAKGFQGSAYVSFKTSKEANKFLRKYRLSGYFTELTGLGGKHKHSLKMKIGSKEFKMHAENPAEPSEILWMNQAYGYYDRYLRLIVVRIIAYIAIVLGLIILAYLKMLSVRNKTF